MSHRCKLVEGLDPQSWFSLFASRLSPQSHLVVSTECNSQMYVMYRSKSVMLKLPIRAYTCITQYLLRHTLTVLAKHQGILHFVTSSGCLPGTIGPMLDVLWYVMQNEDENLIHLVKQTNMVYNCVKQITAKCFMDFFSLYS